MCRHGWPSDGRISVQLIAVDCTGERPVKLRQNVLLVEEKVASRARLEDAQLLAQYVGLWLAPTRIPISLQMRSFEG
jgi:hypothetical protein